MRYLSLPWKLSTLLVPSELEELEKKVCMYFHNASWLPCVVVGFSHNYTSAVINHRHGQIPNLPLHSLRYLENNEGIELPRELRFTEQGDLYRREEVEAMFLKLKEEVAPGSSRKDVQDAFDKMIAQLGQLG